MKKKNIFLISIAAGLISMACSCSLLGLFDQLTPDADDLMDLVPDELDEMLDAVPDELGESLEQLVTAVPDVVEEGIESIPEALSEGDMENLFNQGVPENIPMVEAYDDLLAFGGVINYSTTTGLEAMKTFYQEEMPNYGWTEDTSASSTDLGPYAAALNYINDSQTATITIVESDQQTLVTIIVTDK
ncbi:MAG: hypothetical protein V2J07_04785 [Anaerolineae bacterium]|jgi:hypothetical protein|nr:hypothetical protein [Anaerolineae bacterium]